MARMFLALLLGVVIASCASVGFRTEGASGPVAWQATDLRIIQRPIPGDATREKGDHYTFTLVLRETQGTTITFTHMAWAVYQPDTAPASSESTGQWSLRPHGELRWPFSNYMYCS